MGELLTRPFAGGSAPSDMSRVRGIVLAGTYHWSGSAFEDLLPRPLVPVAQAPLVSYALRWLRDGGVARATICANSASPGRALVPRRRQPPDHEPRVPRGLDAARRGRLRARRGPRQRRRHLVVDRRHRHPRGQHRPAARRPPQLRGGRHRGRPPRPPARSGERPLNPGGIYVFDRRALEHIPRDGFQDIKENLIPKLYRAGERVVTHAGTASARASSTPRPTSP